MNKYGKVKEKRSKRMRKKIKYTYDSDSEYEKELIEYDKQRSSKPPTSSRLKCVKCCVNFRSRNKFLEHHKTHITQPILRLTKIQKPNPSTPTIRILTPEELTQKYEKQKFEQQSNPAFDVNTNNIEIQPISEKYITQKKICPYCFVCFEDKINLKVHVWTHHFENCWQSGSQTQQNYEYIPFLKSPQQKDDECIEEYYIPTTVNNIICERNSVLTHQNNIIQNETVINGLCISQCNTDNCNRMFKSQNSLAQHIKDEHSHIKRKYSCRPCNIRLTSRYDLLSHNKLKHSDKITNVQPPVYGIPLINLNNNQTKHNLVDLGIVNYVHFGSYDGSAMEKEANVFVGPTDSLKMYNQDVNCDFNDKHHSYNLCDNTKFYQPSC